MEKLKNTRILGLVGIVFLILGILLPYYVFQFALIKYTNSISLFGYLEGKIMMGLILANALFIFKDFVSKYVPQLFRSNIGRMVENASPKLSIIPTILVVAFVVWLNFRLNIQTSEYIHYGFGFWSLWIGVIAISLHAFLYRGESSAASEQMMNSNPTLVNPSQGSYDSNSTFGNVNSASAKVKYCPGCGNSCAVDAPKCFMCGRDF